MRDAVETYLRDLRTVRSTGAATKETSYYEPLATLINAVGHELQPRVRTVFQLKNTGAGIPDGGLFAADQLKTLDSEQPLAQTPARGVLEIKGTGDDVETVAKSKQVSGYVERYGQVLVTNYRDFVLVERDSSGAIRESERLSLAADEATFWQDTAQSREFADRIGEQLTEYLHRVMVRQVSLTQPRDVALLLASYARDLRTRLEQQSLSDLAPLRSSLESALGISFEGEAGAHFFRSTVVQTLFYGMFSAWVLQNRGIGRGSKSDAFNWRLAGWSLKVPAIQTLFHEFIKPDSINRLGIADVLDWTGEMLNRIDSDQFFARFSEEHAVQYFYEPFLEAFDPELRKQLGVWYTPHEIVTYMVERVDTVLRDELGVARGLADPNVYVLDPCTGTGSYLVAVLRRIHQTLQAEGADALTANDLKDAVRTRLFGFELLPAPFVVAHLQLGLALQDLGAPLQSGANERPAIFLTNALTGWDVISPDQYTQTRAHQLLAELERERNAAGEIKRDKPILVVIGNPPYNGYAGIGIDEERDLSDAYRLAKRTKQPQGQGLNDLYVRFFRMAERRIVEQTGKGVVCYISNYSWLDGLSFTAMRERYLDVFDQVWIDNLHGDRIISEYAPDGRTSETVFAMQGRSVGIKIGTAISTLVVRNPKRRADSILYYRDMDQARAVERTSALMDSLSEPDMKSHYTVLNPSPGLGLPFKPRAMADDYLHWPLLPELFPVSFPGVKTSRDDVVVDIDRDRLIERMQRYFDPTMSDAEIERLIPGAMESTKRFNATAVRAHLVKRGFLPGRIMRYAYRPFDVRWLYWEPETKMLDEKRDDYEKQLASDNVWISAGQRNRKSDFYQPQAATSIVDHHIVESNAGLFPLWSRSKSTSNVLLEGSESVTPNLSASARRYLAELNLSDGTLFFHALAVMHAPMYRVENAGALRQDWPRIPLPLDPSHLAASAELGRRLAALLDVEQDVPGVTSGTIRPELQGIAVLTKPAGALNPDTDDLALTAGWGRGGNGKAVMPGRGKTVERGMTPPESQAIRAAGDPMGLGAHDPLGDRTVDVHINTHVYWRNVPERVWDYSLGGYQVLKKWLSYREMSVLGRRLHAEEARLFSQIARRIAAIILLEPRLDASYGRCAAETWDWRAAKARNAQPRLWTDD